MGLGEPLGPLEPNGLAHVDSSSATESVFVTNQKVYRVLNSDYPVLEKLATLASSSEQSGHEQPGGQNIDRALQAEIESFMRATLNELAVR